MPGSSGANGEAGLSYRMHASRFTFLRSQPCVLPAVEKPMLDVMLSLPAAEPHSREGEVGAPPEPADQQPAVQQQAVAQAARQRQPAPQQHDDNREVDFDALLGELWGLPVALLPYSVPPGRFLKVSVVTVGT